MSDPASRLKEAREKAGYRSARAAAEAMGVNYAVYGQHENGIRGINRAAERYARFYRVSLDWLISGRGDMRNRSARNTIPVLGTVGAGSHVVMLESTADVVDLGDLTLPEAGRLAALKVTGDSMWPRYYPGEHILFDPEPETPDRLAGRHVVAEMLDGTRMVKLLQRAGKPGYWRLDSHNAPPQETREIRAVYRVLGALE